MFFWSSREIKLQIGSVPNAIKDSRELRELDRDFSRNLNELKNSLLKLNEGFSALNAATSENKYSNIVKQRFCARSIELLHGLVYPETILSAADFYDVMKARINELSSLSIKEFKHLHMFKAEMKAVATVIKAVENDIRSIERILNYPVSKDAIKTGKNLTDIKNLQSSVSAGDEQIKIIISGINEAEKVLQSQRKEMQQALQSGEYMRLRTIRSEMDKLAHNAKTIETKISEEFASLDRIFRKFSHIDSYEQELVDKYIDDSFSAFLDDEDGKIKIILDKMRIAVETGKIENKKHQKLLDVMRSMSLFESLRRQYKELKKRQGEMANDIPPIESELERLRNDIVSSEQTLVKLRRYLETKNRNKEMMIKKLEELNNELANSASAVLGKKVIIIDS